MDMTSAKSFILYPELLNQHVSRVKAAAECASVYMRKSALLDEGLIIIPDFAGAYPAARIAEHIARIAPGDAKRKDSLLINQPLDSNARILGTAILKMLLHFFSDERHTEVRKLFWQSAYLQHIFNLPDDGDIQKHFHCDTFFPALKFWYFPRAVLQDDGPLMYVPGSPFLDENLLGWHARRVREIKDGCEEATRRGRGHMEGSLRITDAEIMHELRAGLVPRAITVEADTLVIANVFGFHRRGDAAAPAHRLAINGSIRTDRPFL